jgi:hypothetical protein
LDFDGVCHSYTSGWKGADVIPDDYVEGLFEFLEAVKDDFDVQVFSSRSHQEGGTAAMTIWFMEQRKLWRSRGGKPPADTPLHIGFPDTKPSAFIGLDDLISRCFLAPQPQAPKSSRRALSHLRAVREAGSHLGS